jgi:phosphoglycerol transferase MdoB-like AlkP superfamily enzyme
MRLASSNHAHWLLFVAFYAVFANIPFWAASHWLGLLPIGWFCLEYAVVGVLALFVPRILSAVLLLVIIMADLTSAVSKTYYISPTECLAQVGSIWELPGSRLLGVAIAAVLILLVISIAALLPVAAIRGTYRVFAAACLATFVILVLSADGLATIRETGSIPNPFQMARPADANRYSNFSNLWMSRYPMIRLVRDERLFGEIRRSAGDSHEDDSFVSSATALAVRKAGFFADKSILKGPNLVLILVESWGLAQDMGVRDALVQPYSRPELLARYEVLQGTVPFNGSTVAGEARELCGNNLGFDILAISDRESHNCLPDRLVALGYRSIALHGMDGGMFNRSTWYKSIGFQGEWFRDEFRQQGLPDCMGAFVGTCDSAIAEWIGNRLEKQDADPDFVYWMTLNSHLPVLIPSALPAAADCSRTSLLSEQPPLCSWYQLVSNVHDSVFRLAMAKLARPTVFVIVGDHAPPFANPALRSQFSGTVVPYVLLLPRTGNGIASQSGN